ncbi:uncharacterized protein LOC110924138 [Helianthus annuus]|uniref:uncharacterized protein LOC110924138 n=1 Tax=Helianthus annuus TaxID=4232 RepID=UPI000B8F5F8C|nr:uncharacterized protein LOC110924138 [Helianthus annuus]
MEVIKVMLWYSGLLDFSFDQPQSEPYFELVEYAMEMDAIKLGIFTCKAVLEEPITVQHAAWAFDLDKETNVQKGVVEEPVGQDKEHSVQEDVVKEPVGQDKVPSVQEGAEEEVFGLDKETAEESSSDDEEGFFEEGNDDEFQDEVIGSESNREDVEWRQSQDAIKQATKDEVAATKKLVEECIKPNEKEVKLHESNDVGYAHIEGYSSYEESDGDIATPGDSEDDDVRGKKYKETAPSLNRLTRRSLLGKLEQGLLQGMLLKRQ